jgi:Arc/MetJ family transcription regulator
MAGFTHRLGWAAQAGHASRCQIVGLGIATPSNMLWVPIFCYISTHMKTTIDIADALLSEARRQAAREGTTVRALVEAGLRRVLSERREKRPFVLRDASVSGNGLQPGIREGDWEQLRDIIYEGRGS